MRGMDDSSPFALLLTWMCYGTWLPGDRRGYVSRTRRGDGTYEPRQNAPGTNFTADHPITRVHAASFQKHETATIERTLARTAAEALIAASAKQNWHIIRAAIMWNHVHVIVTRCPDAGPVVRRVLKGVSQNALSDHEGKPRRWWTRGGSDRYLHGERAITAATKYVANQPGALIEIVDMKVIESKSERRGLSPPAVRGHNPPG